MRSNTTTATRQDPLPLFEPQATTETMTASQEPDAETEVHVDELQEAHGEELELPVADGTADERERSKVHARWTHYFVQPYRMTKVNRTVRLTPVEAFSVASAEAALERANRLLESGRYVGVDAYAVTTEPDGDEYGETKHLARLGRVPNAECEESLE